MPIPMVKCCICNAEVTKRSSLALNVLDPKRDGRACRDHDEVKKLLAAHQADESLKRRWKEAEHNIAVLAAVSWARVQCTFRGLAPGLADFMLDFRVPKAVYTDAIAELRKRGYIMSEEEQQETMAMALLIFMKKEGSSVDSQPSVQAGA